MSWPDFQPVAALACVPAVILLIAAGLAFGDMTAALAASSGALAVGFGAFQQGFRDPAVPMLLACLGISVSAGIGTLANATLAVDVLCVGLWGFGLGMMNMIGKGPGWLALQCTTALVIAAAFPATPAYAAWRFLLVLAGGAVQLAAVLTVRRLSGGRIFAPAARGSLSLPSIIAELRGMLAARPPGYAHAVTMTCAVSVAELLWRLLALPNGPWVPMTVTLILRPATRETVDRALARLCGTFCGVALLTLLMAWLRPPVPVLIGLAAVTAWTCCAFMRVNYAILSLAVTIYVVLLFAIAGLPEPQVALHRAVATALGGVIALCAQLLRLGFARLGRR